MTNIKDLSSLLNWKLLKGGHDFPGPDGGTCINEAAVVVAGFKYRKIYKASDCPPCFSQVLSAYALRINDAMPDGLRQELLLPFVTRLAGTKDTRKVEQQRADVIVIRTVAQILPIVLRLAGLEKQAAACETVTTRETAADAAASAASYAASAANAYYAATAAIIDAANAANAAAIIYTATAAIIDAADAADAAGVEKIWREAAAILDAALAIGKQADPIERNLIIEHVNKAKEMT